MFLCFFLCLFLFLHSSFRYVTVTQVDFLAKHHHLPETTGIACCGVNCGNKLKNILWSSSSLSLPHSSLWKLHTPTHLTEQAEGVTNLISLTVSLRLFTEALNNNECTMTHSKCQLELSVDIWVCICVYGFSKNHTNTDLTNLHLFCLNADQKVVPQNSTAQRRVLSPYDPTPSTLSFHLIIMIYYNLTHNWTKSLVNSYSTYVCKLFLNTHITQNNGTIGTIANFDDK